VKDLATQMHEAMLELGSTSDEVAANLSMAGVRGWVDDLDGFVNPVCLYITGAVGYRCKRQVATILAVGSGRKFVAQAGMEKPCQVYLRRFFRGEYSFTARQDEGCKIRTPWGKGVLKPIGVQGVEWARGKNGLGGLVVKVQWAKDRMSPAAIASGMQVGDLLFYGAAEWGIVARELPWSKKVLLSVQDNVDPRDDEWTIEFHLNTTAEGRAYLIASGSSQLWPASAVTDCRQGAEKDTAWVRTVAGERFVVSLTSVNVCRKRGGSRPMMIDALEIIPDAEIPF
jgi:hypothetical protein